MSALATTRDDGGGLEIVCQENPQDPLPEQFEQLEEILHGELAIRRQTADAGLRVLRAVELLARKADPGGRFPPEELLGHFRLVRTGAEEDVRCLRLL